MQDLPLFDDMPPLPPLPAIASPALGAGRKRSGSEAWSVASSDSTASSYSVEAAAVNGSSKSEASNKSTASFESNDSSENAPIVETTLCHRRSNAATRAWGFEFWPKSSEDSKPSKPPFNVYRAILRHPNLFFQFALRLPFESMIDLYAIDKEFHYRVNKYSVSLIHDYAKYHAPVASYIFSWVLYPSLCITDPMLKPVDGRQWLARDIPSFRWVRRVLFRQKVVRNILTLLALEGHRVPRHTDATLMKYWCLMEMKTNAMRKAFLADKSLWANDDIIRFHLFLVKLDMRFSDPVTGHGFRSLSHLVLTQPSLRSLWLLLTGQKKLDVDDVEIIALRTYHPNTLDIETNPWIDDETVAAIPEDEWGALTHEHWHSLGAPMPSAMDRVIDEGIIRGLHAEQYMFDFVLYGYSHGDKKSHIPTPKVEGNSNKVSVPQKGRPNERDMYQVRMKVLASMMERPKGKEKEQEDLEAIKLLETYGHDK